MKKIILIIMLFFASFLQAQKTHFFNNVNATAFTGNGSALTGITTGSLVGEITMYFGDISVFPTATHALCDGLNGTPDLRGKFVRGWSDAAGQEYAGSIARINTDQADATSKPDINFVTNNTGNHVHSSSGGTGRTNSWAHIDSNGVATGADVAYDLTQTNNGVSAWLNVTLDAAGNHEHSVSSGGDIETRPKNYALAYIMRIN